MLVRTGLDAPEALVCTMVLVAAADGAITDREIGVMAGLVQTLPAFQDFSSEHLEFASDAAVVVAANRTTSQAVLRMLELVQGELRLEPLVAAAIERGVKARYQTTERAD